MFILICYNLTNFFGLLFQIKFSYSMLVKLDLKVIILLLSSIVSRLLHTTPQKSRISLYITSGITTSTMLFYGSYLVCLYKSKWSNGLLINQRATTKAPCVVHTPLFFTTTFFYSHRIDLLCTHSVSEWKEFLGRRWNELSIKIV